MASLCRGVFYGGVLINQTFCKDNTPTSSYREVKIGRTVYRVTSVFTGEKDLGKTLEHLAIQRALTEMPASAG